MRATAILAALAITGCAQADAKLPVETAQQAIAAAQDCAEAAKAGEVNRETLVARGWTKASLSSVGKEVEASATFYGKAQRGPLIMLVEGSPGCIFTGSLEGSRAFSEISDAFSSAFRSVGNRNGDLYYRAGTDLVVLTQTGSKREPSFRVLVMESGD